MDLLETSILRAKYARLTPINKPSRPAPPPLPPPLCPHCEQRHDIGNPCRKPAPIAPRVLPGVAPWRNVSPPADFPPRPITLKKIVALVAAEFNVTPEQIRGHYRTKKFVFPRHVAQYLAQRVLERSLPIIGRYFYRDHTSVLNGIRKIKRMADEDHDVREIVEKLESRIRNGRNV